MNYNRTRDTSSTWTFVLRVRSQSGSTRKNISTERQWEQNHSRPRLQIRIKDTKISLIRSGFRYLYPGYLIDSGCCLLQSDLSIFLPKHQLTFLVLEEILWKTSTITEVELSRCSSLVQIVTTAEFCLFSHSSVTKVLPFALSRRSMSNASVLGFWNCTDEPQ